MKIIKKSLSFIPKALKGVRPTTEELLEAGWTDRPWRPVWTGYTPEQRRLLRDGNKPAAVSHKELV